MLRSLLLDKDKLAVGEAVQLQRALTDLHLIHASLLDQSLNEFPTETTLANGANNHAA